MSTADDFCHLLLITALLPIVVFNFTFGSIFVGGSCNCDDEVDDDDDDSGSIDTGGSIIWLLLMLMELVDFEAAIFVFLLLLTVLAGVLVWSSLSPRITQ